MKNKLITLGVSMCLLLTGCGASSDTTSMSASNALVGNYPKSENLTEEVMYEDAKTEEQSNVEINYEDKLVYTCYMELETLTYDDTIKQLKQAIQNRKGFIQLESVYVNSYSGYGKTRHCNLSIRVPSEQYNIFLQEVAESGSMTSMNSQVDNITQQYYDTETRVKALKIQEQRLLEMMENCETVADMITVEDRLSEVQSEVAVYQTELNLMEKDVAYSTVNIDIQEVAEISVHEDSQWQRFIDVIKKSLSFFVRVVKIVGTFIIYIFPFLLTAGVALFVIRVIKKNNKKVKKGNEKQKVQEKECKETDTRKTKIEENLAGKAVETDDQKEK